MSTVINNSNFPPQGTHFSDGLRSGDLYPGSGRIFTNSSGQKFYINVPGNYLNNTPGVELSERFTYRIQPMQAVSNNIVSSGSNTVGPGYLTLLADLTTTHRVMFLNDSVIAVDVPRTLTVTRVNTSDQAIIYIWGYNKGRADIFDQITLNSGIASATGNIAFEYILAVYVSEANQWSVGTSNVLGLPFYVQTFGDISNPIWNNAVLASSAFTAGDTTNPPTATSGDPRGLITLTSPLAVPNGSIWLCLNMYLQGADTKTTNSGSVSPNLIVGVPPYYIPEFSS